MATPSYSPSSSPAQASPKTVVSDSGDGSFGKRGADKLLTEYFPENYLDYLGAVKQVLLTAVPSMDNQRSQHLHDVIEYALGTPGKLLRPMLCLMIAHATQPSSQGDSETAVTDNHITTAAVAEMIHVATLLHDDVLDDADTRRGKTTARLKWNNTIAILGGDYLLAQASRLLAQIGNIRLVSIYSDVLADLCDGEIEQLRTQYALTLDWESYYKKTRCKTASLFAAACESAGVLNQLDEPIIQHCKAFGDNVGQAFQLVDDLLDFQSTQAQTGKPILNDLRQGLITAPVLLAYEDGRLNSNEQSQLSGAIQQLFDDSNNLTALDAIQALLTKAHAYQATQAMADKLVSNAQYHLEQAISDSDKRAPLEALTQLLIKRNK